MSNVVLRIGGRNFTVACAQGEESHVNQLGGMIDEKLKAIEGVAGQSESRMLLFAALLLADELHEISRASSSAQSPSLIEDATAGRLEAIAEKLENLASSLEAGSP